MAHLVPFNGKHPQVHPSAWLAPNATLIGDVRIGLSASLWFGVVLRADEAYIEVGEGSNLQDNTVVHNDADIPTIVGPDVSVGHLALLHSTSIGRGSLIGMGAKLLSHSVIGEGAFVAAGALVREWQRVEAEHLVAGVPARDHGLVQKEMTERVTQNAIHYQELAARYRAEGV